MADDKQIQKAEQERYAHEQEYVTLKDAETPAKVGRDSHGGRAVCGCGTTGDPGAHGAADREHGCTK
jgi:hypothetical protein